MKKKKKIMHYTWDLAYGVYNDVIIKNEDYKNVTKEQVRKYYDYSHK